MTIVPSGPGGRNGTAEDPMTEDRRSHIHGLDRSQSLSVNFYTFLPSPLIGIQLLVIKSGSYNNSARGGCEMGDHGDCLT